MSSLSGLSEFVEENKVRVYCVEYCMKLVYSIIIVQYLYAAYCICRACIQCNYCTVLVCSILHM